MLRPHRPTKVQRQVLQWMKAHGKAGAMKFWPGRKNTWLAGYSSYDRPGDGGHWSIVCSWIVIDALKRHGYIRPSDAQDKLVYHLTGVGEKMATGKSERNE